jgi:hypothetical protein
MDAIVPQATHTSGPWEVHGAVHRGKVLFWSINEASAAKYRGDIATVHDAEHMGGISTAERDANARLIAAAPDMLAALKAILSHKPDYADAIWDQVEDAIAKADPFTRRDGPVLREGVADV